MKTLADLHTYWRQQFDVLHAQEDTPLRNLRILAWLSFQLPLALDTSVHFYKHIGEHWCDAVYTIMQYRFDNIIKSKMTEREGDCEYWDLRTIALIALNDAGANAITPVLQSEKNVGKIEAYKQQQYSLNQFLHSFFRNSYDLVAHEFEDGNWAQDKMLLFFSRVQHNTQRSDKVLQKAQFILKQGGFACIGATYDVSNENLLKAMDTLLSSMALCEKSALPQTIAGLDGCNILFESKGTRAGAFSESNNCIHLTVGDEDPLTFWHEWMHMLEARVNWAVSLRKCPAPWRKYHQLADDINQINKMIRTTPHDPNISHLYFNPFSELNIYVNVLCEEAWLNSIARKALCDELNDQTYHPIYNMEVFKEILRSDASVEQRDTRMSRLCNQWRNDEECEFGDDFLDCSGFYDVKIVQRLHFQQQLQHHSNFVIAAKALDWDRTSAYWSHPEELLARGLESFIEDHWAGQRRGFNDRYPQGQERVYLGEVFGTFMHAFKKAWTNQNNTASVSAQQRAQKHTVCAPTKKTPHTILI